jgi:hypothetical protein
MNEARQRVRWRLYCRNGIGHQQRAIESSKARVFAINDHFFVLVVGTRGEVLGGGPWRKTTASFDAPRWCNNNSGSWSATTTMTMRVNGNASADLYCSSNSSPMPRLSQP